MGRVAELASLGAALTFIIAIANRPARRGAVRVVRSGHSDVGLLRHLVYTVGRGILTMQTVEAIIDERGNVRLLEPVRLDKAHRALVTIIDDRPSEAVHDAALLSEQALAEDWNRPEEDEAWPPLQPAR